MTELSFDLVSADGGRSMEVEIAPLGIAGWTGRDRAAMERHIEELEALDIPRPAETPVFYRVAASRLTQARTIEVPGEGSSGEAEAVVLRHAGTLYLGLGSDHTDREAERQGITLSKQLCDKPVAGTLWPLAEVLAHWDRLELRSWIAEDGERRLYQEGAVAAMLPPEALLTGLERLAAPLPDGGLMFCGTLPALGGVRPARDFAAELVDPLLDRRIALAYRVATLPVRG